MSYDETYPPLPPGYNNLAFAALMPETGYPLATFMFDSSAAYDDPQNSILNDTLLPAVEKLLFHLDVIPNIQGSFTASYTEPVNTTAVDDMNGKPALAMYVPVLLPATEEEGVSDFNTRLNQVFLYPISEAAKDVLGFIDLRFL